MFEAGIILGFFSFLFLAFTGGRESHSSRWDTQWGGVVPQCSSSKVLDACWEGSLTRQGHTRNDQTSRENFEASREREIITVLIHDN